MTEAEREWRKQNAEKLKADKARWYQENREKHDARAKAWIEANPEDRKQIVKRYHDTHDLQHRLANERAKSKRRGYAFSMTINEVIHADAEQDGRCAICGCKNDGTKLHIDHCHATGGFRGLLCAECNLMLGKADDDPARLRSAANYLERSSVDYDFDGHA